jgi:hypothetical protein
LLPKNYNRLHFFYIPNCSGLYKKEVTRIRPEPSAQLGPYSKGRRSFHYLASKLTTSVTKQITTSSPSAKKSLFFASRSNNRATVKVSPVSFVPSMMQDAVNLIANGTLKLLVANR